MKWLPHLRQHAQPLQHVIGFGNQRLADVEPRKALARSKSSTRCPARAISVAAVEPAGPPPITTTGSRAACADERPLGQSGWAESGDRRLDAAALEGKDGGQDLTHSRGRAIAATTPRVARNLSYAVRAAGNLEPLQLNHKWAAMTVKTIIV